MPRGLEKPICEQWIGKQPDHRILQGIFQCYLGIFSGSELYFRLLALTGYQLGVNDISIGLFDLYRHGQFSNCISSPESFLEIIVELAEFNQNGDIAVG